MKKLISLLLVLVMVVGIAPDFPELFDFEMTAEAALAGTTSDGYEYEVSDTGEVTITGYSGDETELVIPGTIDGYSVQAIGDRAFFECTGLTSITIPDGVASIGVRAFYRCNNLANIIIPDSVTNISEYAFIYCISLTDITIPDGVTSIEGSTFENCSSLTNVIIPKNVTSIGKGAFRSCSSLTSITIPASVTSIDDFAFYGCGSLASVTILDSVTSIGDDVFSNCHSLTSVSIPGSLASTGDYTFYYCKNLSSVTIEEGVSTIGKFAFFTCESLTSVSIPLSVITIDTAAFYFSENITDVYYSGTEEQWRAISIREQNESLLKANIHYLGLTEIPSGEDTPDTTGNSSTIHVEAEDFASQSGVAVAPKKYAGATVINSISKGDTVTYDVVVPVTGNYTVGINVSSQYEGSKTAKVYVDGKDAGQVVIESTGSWTTFNVFTSDEVSLSAGKHSVTIEAYSGGSYLVDWIEFTRNDSSEEFGDNEAPFDTPETTESETTTEESSGVSDLVHVEAENFVSQSGITVASKQYAGATVINSIAKGDTVTYDVDISKTGNYITNIRVASLYEGTKTVKIYVDGEYAGQIMVDSTGSWTVFNTFKSDEIYMEAGKHSVTFEAASGGSYLVDWVEFEALTD